MSKRWKQAKSSIWSLNTLGAWSLYATVDGFMWSWKPTSLAPTRSQPPPMWAMHTQTTLRGHEPLPHINEAQTTPRSNNFYAIAKLALQSRCSAMHQKISRYNSIRNASKLPLNSLKPPGTLYNYHNKSVYLIQMCTKAQNTKNNF